MVYSYAFNPASKQQMYVEYVEETTFGTFPAPATSPRGPNMKWFGSITNFDDQSKIKTDSKNFLAPASMTSRTSAFKNMKTGEEVGFTMDHLVQKDYVLSTLCYPLGANAAAVTATTGATALAISDQLPSISVGQVFTNPNWDNTKRFVKYSGMLCEDLTLTIPDEGAVTCKSKWVGTNKVYGADYIGSETTEGAHAADPCTAILNSSALSAFKIRTSTQGAVTATAWASVPTCRDAIGGIELKFTNKIGLPKDINTNTVTKIKGAALLGRKATIALDITYAELTGGDIADAITLENIRSFDPFDIQFIFDGYQYEYSRVRFPELPYKAGGEDLLGDKITSLPVGDVCSGTSALVITKVP